MTDRELMQMALYALEGYARNCRCEGGGAPCDAAEALRARLEKWTADDTAYRPGGLPQEEQELVAWSRVNMNDHKEGDLGIGTTPYAAQAAVVAGQTQGRMYVDPVTGDVGIGTVKWDASAPLVVHPHPAFQTTEPQREWIGLRDEERYLNEPRSAEEIEYAKAIEAKLKEKNT